MATKRQQKAATPLGEYDGKPIFGATIKLTNAGDGLSKALKIDPEPLHIGDRVFVVVECELTKQLIEPTQMSDAWYVTHTLKAGVATIVDEAQVDGVLAAQREKLRVAEEADRAAKGEAPLPGTGRQRYDDYGDPVDEDEGAWYDGAIESIAERVKGGV